MLLASNQTMQHGFDDDLYDDCSVVSEMPDWSRSSRDTGTTSSSSTPSGSWHSNLLRDDDDDHDVENERRKPLGGERQAKANRVKDRLNNRKKDQPKVVEISTGFYGQEEQQTPRKSKSKKSEGKKYRNYSNQSNYDTNEELSASDNDFVDNLRTSREESFKSTETSDSKKRSSKKKSSSRSKPKMILLETHQEDEESEPEFMNSRHNSRSSHDKRGGSHRQASDLDEAEAEAAPARPRRSRSVDRPRKRSSSVEKPKRSTEEKRQFEDYPEERRPRRSSSLERPRPKLQQEQEEADASERERAPRPRRSSSVTRPRRQDESEEEEVVARPRRSSSISKPRRRNEESEEEKVVVRPRRSSSVSRPRGRDDGDEDEKPQRPRRSSSVGRPRTTRGGGSSSDEARKPSHGSSPSVVPGAKVTNEFNRAMDTAASLGLDVEGLEEDARAAFSEIISKRIEARMKEEKQDKDEVEDKRAALADKISRKLGEARRKDENKAQDDEGPSRGAFADIISKRLEDAKRKEDTKGNEETEGKRERRRYSTLSTESAQPLRRSVVPPQGSHHKRRTEDGEGRLEHRRHGRGSEESQDTDLRRSTHGAPSETPRPRRSRSVDRPRNSVNPPARGSQEWDNGEAPVEISHREGRSRRSAGEDGEKRRRSQSVEKYLQYRKTANRVPDSILTTDSENSLPPNQSFSSGSGHGDRQLTATPQSGTEQDDVPRTTRRRRSSISGFQDLDKETTAASAGLPIDKAFDLDLNERWKTNKEQKSQGLSSSKPRHENTQTRAKRRSSLSGAIAMGGGGIDLSTLKDLEESAGPAVSFASSTNNAPGGNRKTLSRDPENKSFRRKKDTLTGLTKERFLEKFT